MGHRTDQDAARAAVLSAALAPDGMLDLGRLRQFAPAEWADRASLSLDGVIRVSQVTAAPAVPATVRNHLDALAPALAMRQLSGEDAVDALAAAHHLSALLADARLHATRELTARTAQKALQLKGVTSPEELSRTAHERWRARSKSVTAAELQTLTGLGRGAAREVIAIANAPDTCRIPARQGLAAGIAGWDLVVAWWRRCARMPHEASAAVACALFGTDVSPEQAARERLTPEGELSTLPWAKKQFYDALEREAAVQEGADPAAQEKKRKAQHAARDAYGIVDDDGTAQLVIRGDVASVTGCLERLQSMARKARDAGDPRTEAQLRSDLARALLLHGTLPLPDLGDDPNVITPEDIQRLVHVLAATPAHEVQVIVPWDVLTGQAAIVNPCPPSIHTAAGATGPTGAADPAGVVDPAGRGVVEGVGRVLGRSSRFLSAAEVRAIAGRPGTTLYRLLTDPADGRCLERSVARYAPDAAMRTQLRAADVMSRAPGSTVPARDSDLDHVQEYLLGGATAETNLQAVDRSWHALKTEKFWDAVMDASRNVTWGSFWGRLYRTRPHDYRQYLSRPRTQTPDQAGPVPNLTCEERRHLASLLVYAALAHRGTGDRLEADDDDPASDTEILGLREAIWIRHTTGSGRRRTGPRPSTPTPEQLVTHDPHVVLDHPDWLTLGDADSPPEKNETGDGDDAPPAEPAAPPPF